MKTTLDIDGRLLAEAKATAVLEPSTLTRLIEEGLVLRLRKSGNTASRVRRDLPVYAGRGGLAPAIDARSNRSLFNAARES